LHDLSGKHIVILGKSGSGYLCPFDGDEHWGVNNVASQTALCPDCEGKGKKEEISCLKCQGTGKILQYERKFDKLFAFDFLDKAYTDEMKKYAPVMSWQPYADIRYPLEDVLAEFKTRYFTNTISYMIAYAAYLKASKISVYGVDISFGAPYAQENRGVEYWLGRAQERGIEVYYPPKSHLLRTVYGNLYGEVNECNMLFYLGERINLINILPRQGHYSDAIKSQNAWWVLFPKDDEAKEHNVKFLKDPAGNMSFQVPTEYASDVQMPPEVWQFLRDIMINMETTGTLPYGLISVYEKLVLGKESTK
jgi:hypothetical protein